MLSVLPIDVMTGERYGINEQELALFILASRASNSQLDLEACTRQVAGAGYATPGGQSDAAASSMAGPYGSPGSQPASPISNGDASPGPFTSLDEDSSPRKGSGSMQSIVSSLSCC